MDVKEVNGNVLHALCISHEPLDGVRDGNKRRDFIKQKKKLMLRDSM
jgi:hypothetical protein